jgi:tripartite-type tricarboxylate transporter receptor subunit TctC
MKRWVAIFGIVTACAAPAWAQDFPKAMIKIVAPYPPGGPTDVGARLLSSEFQRVFGQTVIVENRGGASGTLGAAAVAKAPADGHTLLLTIGSHTLAPAILKDVPYDTVNDLVGVSLVFSVPNIIILPPNSPIKTLADLVAMAKASPGKLTYGTGGPGTTTHVLAKILEQAAGISLTHVPFRGGAAAIQGAVAGTVDMTVTVANTALPLVKSGHVRALVLSSEKRSPLLPDVPTFNESGFPQLTSDSWIGLLAPAGTPKPIRERLQQVVAQYVNAPEMHERILAQGLEPRGTKPDEFQAQIATEVAKYREVISKIDLQLDR